MFSDLVNKIIQPLNLLIPLIIALTLVFFIWGVTIYIANSGSAEKRKEGIQYIFYGIIGLFVIGSVWALVYLLANTFGFGQPIIFQFPAYP